jgi:hypothetical protein
LDLVWTEQNTTPQDLVGSSSFRYTAGDWSLDVSYPLVNPPETIYQIAVSNPKTGFGWQGQVDAQGQVSQTADAQGEATGAGSGQAEAAGESTPLVDSWTEPVEDWAGVIVGNPPDAQFDDYFEWQSFEGGQYGIESGSPEIQARIEQMRDTGQTVRLWGVLHHNVPDVNGTQIRVTRLEAQEVPAPPQIVEEPVEAWLGTLVKLPVGGQLGGYFERQDGQRFGIWGANEASQAALANARWTGAQVQVWGVLATGVPDYENRQIRVERVEAVSGPAQESRNLSPFSTPSASSVLPSDRWGTYHAWSAVDGLLSTPWTEGVDGPGVGEWIQLDFPGTIEVHSIGIAVGYDRDEDDQLRDPSVFQANNRLKRATLVFSNGEQVELSFADERGVQQVSLARAPGPSIQTTYVRVVIEEVYPGSTYDDTCLAEIEVWGKTQ